MSSCMQLFWSFFTYILPRWICLANFWCNLFVWVQKCIWSYLWIHCLYFALFYENFKTKYVWTSANFLFFVVPTGNLILSRRAVSEQMTDIISRSNKPACRVEVTEKLIETFYDLPFHADFANQFIGGKKITIYFWSWIFFKLFFV